VRNLWSESEAAKIANDDLALRVYSSRLLGQEEDLVLHGGGNTSVKSTSTNIFGETSDVLYVKGSGWDLKTIEKAGFPPLELHTVKRLAEQETLSDTEMVKQLRLALLDPFSPNPSIEAILHGIIPYKHVDHTHADAIVVLTNTKDGDKVVQEVFPDFIILPYVMPGFVLAQQVQKALTNCDVSKYKGIILKSHGIFTFADDAKESYDMMIEAVTRAENYIKDNRKSEREIKEASAEDYLSLAQIRKSISTIRGSAVLVNSNFSPEACGYASRKDVGEIATQGPLTPDHSIRTKRAPAILGKEPEKDIQEFVENYKAYFEKNKHKQEGLQCLDPSPNFAIWKNKGILSFGSSLKDSGIIADIARHTAEATQDAKALGAWNALGEDDLFDIEYWELEQAKLSKGGNKKPLQGKVALVTGSAAGIGLACARELQQQGACVIGMDLSPKVLESMCEADFQGVVGNVTIEQDLRNAVHMAIDLYGGLDIVVANAGIFTAGSHIEALEDNTWDKTMSINLTSQQRLLKICIPYLKEGIEPTFLFVGSRNVAAPGAGASAYSVSKAGITQLARVAALELAPSGIRVNVIHPDAVFDTELWTDEVLERSAKRYNMTVQEYKTKNLLKTEITSADVANATAALVGPIFLKTTGAQFPVDGGNDRVI